MSQWEDQWRSSLMSNYGTPPVELVRGSGARVWDVAGNEYIDLLGGIAVNSLGHANPYLVDAVTTQLKTLGHTSNLAATVPTIALAERLRALLDQPSARVFFCNSGAEANEAAFKLARLTGRTAMVVAQGGFHGRTMGALSLTAQPAKQDPFRPLPGDVTAVPFGDSKALAAAVDDSVAAIVLEPIQGESGVIVPPAGYLRAARDIADAHGALLILDEVQTGMGRTGDWFAHTTEGITPDVLTLAKGLGGGLPIGACIGFGRAAELFTPGSHGSTFGGNPVSCAAALAVIETIERESLLARATELGEHLGTTLVEVSGGAIRGHRGRGLLMAFLTEGIPASEFEAAARRHGLLVNGIAPDVIRLAPPLILSDQDAEDAIARWSSTCEELLS